MAHQLVIRNGTIVDGTGSPPYPGDLAVDAGRITAIGRVDGDGAEEIDATGLVVTPGFVDPHTHLDAQLCWDPDATPSSLHGVTTVLMGMCGFGIAPCADGGGDYLLQSLERVEEIPFESSSLGVPFAWSTWPEYLTYLESQPLAVNFGGMVPHSALRCFVMGDRARQGPATAEERRQLAQELRRSLDGGALGFATSRGTNHYDAFGAPVPSRFADDAELRELVMECSGRPWQINLATKVAPEAAPMLDEVDVYAAWTEEAGARLTWSPFFAEPTEEVWREVLDHHHALNHKVVVKPQVSPGPFTTTLRFDGDKIAGVTGWKSVMTGFASLDRPARIQRLMDPHVREMLRQAPDAYANMPLAERPRFGVPPSYDAWMIIDTARPELLGLTLVEAAERSGVAPSDLLCDLAVADDLQIEVQVPIVNGNWRAAAVLSADEDTLIGLGDSGAHVSTVTNYVYPTDLLARLVRDEQLFTLEAAVQRITSDPARFFGVPGRGELRVGYYADLCVINLPRLGVGRLEVRRDLPGGAPRLFRDAQGYAAVVVNGEVTIRDDNFTGARSGRAVRASDLATSIA
ncbi:MAG: amidohydrolase family protein [Microbacterium sp.]